LICYSGTDTGTEKKNTEIEPFTEIVISGRTGTEPATYICLGFIPCI